MGLLDDAIKEHLDLKRRRGADPTEVERAEREALGPVRRNRESAGASEVEDEQVDAGGLAYDQTGDAGWADEVADERPLEGEPEDERGAPPLELLRKKRTSRFRRAKPQPAVDEPAVDEPAFDDSAFGESAFEEPAFDDGPAPAPAPRFDPGGETGEYNVEEALSADESDEDVLEETPEFLQDTPDHDRLWFEQRPPKDFDFDG
jgi:hypothetical protein